ncbi:MAG: HK97 family phage prohead protease [Xanthobacteraceae bacterium]
MTRLFGAGIPVLDSHSQGSIDKVLGRLTNARATGREVLGTIKFSATEAGRLAEGMVRRGELRSVSAGYAVDEWRAEDAEGREVLAVEGEDDLTFYATRWRLLELSIVAVPADGNAMIRSRGYPMAELARARMEARQRMMSRYARVLRHVG